MGIKGQYIGRVEQIPPEIRRTEGWMIALTASNSCEIFEVRSMFLIHV